MTAKRLKICRKCGENKALEEFAWRNKAENRRHLKCKACFRSGHLLRRYNLSEDDYKTEYDALEGRCPLCDRFYDVLAVDHDHVSGDRRGLLCLSCNRALAFVEDDEWMKKARTYLEKHHG